MTEDSQHKFAAAFASLTALRENINKISGLVPEAYVREFHTHLGTLQGLGIDVSPFHIPHSEVQPRVTAISDSRTHYSEEKYVHAPFILTKLDGVLNYLSILSNKPKHIGLQRSDK